MKKLLLVVSLALVLCFTFGCQDKEAMAELEAMKAKTKLEDQNRELVTRCFDEVNKGNVDVLYGILSPEGLFYSPSVNSKPRSQEGKIETIRMILKVFPDINWKIEKLFVVGDTAIIWSTVTGTHQREFMGIPATGNQVKIGSILIWTIKDGKIVEEREEYDSLGLMMQLGMELKPEEVKK
jgi:steroid delta-isomerase-like uncharacterized protein